MSREKGKPFTGGSRLEDGVKWLPGDAPSQRNDSTLPPGWQAHASGMAQHIPDIAPVWIVNGEPALFGDIEYGDPFCAMGHISLEAKCKQCESEATEETNDG